jgi:hypothetical protein
MVAVPSWLSTRLRPVGRPAAPMEGAGYPEVVTRYDEGEPAVNVAEG